MICPLCTTGSAVVVPQAYPLWQSDSLTAASPVPVVGWAIHRHAIDADGNDLPRDFPALDSYAVGESQTVEAITPYGVQPYPARAVYGATSIEALAASSVQSQHLIDSR